MEIFIGRKDIHDQLTLKQWNNTKYVKKYKVNWVYCKIIFASVLSFSVTVIVSKKSDEILVVKPSRLVYYYGSWC